MNLHEMRRVRAEMLAAGALPDRPRAKQAGDTAEIYLYDVIDSWGAPWGISAKEFNATLREIAADQLTVHINSPGGDAFEGIAIMNALRQHKARVTVVVDGLAASAASYIACAGDDVVMSLGSQIMVHDPWGFAMGNADVMADTGARLDKLADGMAEIYAERTGGTVEEWRAVQREEKWFNATEAVEVGLADRVDTARGNEQQTEAAKARALALVEPTARIEPGTITGASITPGFIGAPQTPSAEPVASTIPNPTQEVNVSDDTSTLRAGICQRLGIPADSDDEKILAATEKAKAPAEAAGPDQLAEITRLSSEVSALRAEKAAEVKTSFFDLAAQQGRIKASERTELEAMYDGAPEATKAFVLARAVGSEVPVAEVGHEGGAQAGTYTDDERTAWESLVGLPEGSLK